MDFKKVLIKKEKDFDLLRDIDLYDTKDIYITLDDNIKFKEPIKPIDLSNQNVYIIGNFNILSNICIINKEPYDDKKYAGYTGLFSKAKNITVNNLVINESFVCGGEICGTLAGEVEEEIALNGVRFEGLDVYSEAYGGGVAGICDTMTIIDSGISSKVSGIDVVGGVVGLTKSYSSTNTNVSTETIKTGSDLAKCFGREVGYCDKKNIKCYSRDN